MRYDKDMIYLNFVGLNIYIYRIDFENKDI